jgi:type VI secretion system protein ImpH
MEAMGTDDGPTDGSLSELLGREAYRFDFYQAVRLLELLRPERTPVGHGGSNVEPVAFQSKVGLDFPASDIVSAEFPADDAQPVRLTVAFMGLAGGAGPLPAPFTELVIQRNADRSKDHFATRDFLDIFNHRLISFLYRSRKKHRVALNNRPPEQTQWAGWLFDLAGLKFAAEERDSRRFASDNRASRRWARTLLRYSGILSNQVRSMTGLEAMLADYFGVRVSGEQLLGRWLRIEPRDQTRIGVRLGANQRLGIDAVLGDRAWDQMGRVRLHLSAMKLSRLREFLPTGPAFKALAHIARVHLQQDIDIDLRLALEPNQASGMRLSLSADSRLGWTSWLNTGRSGPGDDSVRLRLPALYQDRSPQMKAA